MPVRRFQYPEGETPSAITNVPPQEPTSSDEGRKGAGGATIKHIDIEELTEFHTPLEKIFKVRHMGTPDLSESVVANWRLNVCGLVGKELSLSLKDLAEMEQVELLSFHECAGIPALPNFPVRRIANVAWRGVRLSDVLAKAGGVRPEAKYIISQGADSGVYDGKEHPRFLKDFPAEEPTNRPDELLLCTHLNGEPLALERGGPLRLVLPGFYATNSTKWLEKLEASETRADGYFTTAVYNEKIRQVKDGEGFTTIIEGVAKNNKGDPEPSKSGNEKISTRPTWRVAPHAVIVSPAEDGGSVTAGETVEVRGWAWGATEIAKVEVSTDDGKSWRPAKLDPRKEKTHAWQGWTAEWTPPANLEAATLCCRARDQAGEVQPWEGARNEVHRFEVQVRAPAQAATSKL